MTLPISWETIAHTQKNEPHSSLAYKVFHSSLFNYSPTLLSIKKCCLPSSPLSLIFRNIFSSSLSHYEGCLIFLQLTQSSSSTLFCPSPLPDPSPQTTPTSPRLPASTQRRYSSTRSHPYYLNLSAFLPSVSLSPSDPSLSYFCHSIVSAH